MRKAIRILFRVLFVFTGIFILLVAFLLNPQPLYAKNRQYQHVTIYSEKEAPVNFNKIIDEAINKTRQSELFSADFHYEVFINDGSAFPSVLKRFLGEGFAWGYHNNIVLNGTNDADLKYILLNGQKRLLAITLAHEMIHCLQARHFGLFKSRPLKNIPHWKWEGYPEYIAYKTAGENSDSLLLKNLFLLDSLKMQTYFPVVIETKEGPSFAGLDYFRWWLLVKYCIDIKQLRFASIIKDEIIYDTVYAEMMEWYRKNNQAGVSPPDGP